MLNWNWGVLLVQIKTSSKGWTAFQSGLVTSKWDLKRDLLHQRADFLSLVLRKDWRVLWSWIKSLAENLSGPFLLYLAEWAILEGIKHPLHCYIIPSKKFSQVWVCATLSKSLLPSHCNCTSNAPVYELLDVSQGNISFSYTVFILAFSKRSTVYFFVE